MKTITTTILCMIALFCKAQLACHCPLTDPSGTKSTAIIKADTSFHLSNGKIIALCGSINTDSKPITFSEFTLSVCGTDTAIDFWDATLICKVRAKKDTLLVEDIEDLPNGKKFRHKNNIWTTEKIYFSGNSIIRKLGVNRNISKYDQATIVIVNKVFEKTKPGEMDVNKEELMNRLFVATISGNNTSRKFFKEFLIKYKLDGAYEEEYDYLTGMLDLWDSNK